MYLTVFSVFSIFISPCTAVCVIFTGLSSNSFVLCSAGSIIWVKILILRQPPLTIPCAQRGLSPLPVVEGMFQNWFEENDWGAVCCLWLSVSLYLCSSPPGYVIKNWLLFAGGTRPTLPFYKSLWNISNIRQGFRNTTVNACVLPLSSRNNTLGTQLGLL